MWPQAIGVSVEANWGCAWLLLKPHRARLKTANGFDWRPPRDQLLTDPRRAADFVAKTQGRRPGDRDRHQPRRYKFTRSPPAKCWPSPDRRRFTRPSTPPTPTLVMQRLQARSPRNGWT